jgi:hypothetical protein
MLTNLAVMNAFREGAGEAENTTSLGEIGQSLGFTRAVVQKTSTSLDASFSVSLPDLVMNTTVSTGNNGTNSSFDLSLSRKG